jgi:hypothetical protein
MEYNVTVWKGHWLIPPRCVVFMVPQHDKKSSMTMCIPSKLKHSYYARRYG